MTINFSQIISTPSRTGSLNAGQTVRFSLSASGLAFRVSGNPVLTRSDGATAIYVGGSGTTELAFSYTVADGNNAADLQVTGLSLNGGSIEGGFNLFFGFFSARRP